MSLGKGYLVLYNSVQFLGWSFLLLELVGHLLDGGSLVDLYPTVELTLKIFQSLALLEVVHGVAGLVRSNVQVTIQQTVGRNYIAWIILGIPAAQGSIGLPMVLFAWTITEIIRYSLYVIQLISTPPYWMTWIRYTFFIPAYPVGITGELLCSFAAFQHASKTSMYSVELPNWLNSTFSFPLLIIAIMLMYIPLFPPMYLHLLAQRKKVLAGPKQE